MAGGDGDDGQGIGARGCDVGGRVADDDDGGVFAGKLAGCGCCRGDHVGALLVRIAEAAEGEVLAQSGALQLEPADGFEIAGGDAEPLARAARWRSASTTPGMMVSCMLAASRSTVEQMASSRRG